jgi:hypothetical protein
LSNDERLGEKNRADGNICEYRGLSLMMIRVKVPRKLRKILMLIVSAWVVVWCIASLAAPKVVAMVQPKVQAKSKSMGVVIDRIQYKKIRVSPWLTSVTAHEVAIDFDLAPGDKHQLSSTFRSKTIQVRLRNLFKMRGSVKMDDFEVIFHASDRPKNFPFDRFIDGHVQLADLPLLSPRDALSEMIAGVIDLFDDNKTKGKFEFSGVVQVKVGAKNLPARLYSESHGDEYRLRFSADDVRSATKAMHMDLADDQVAMVSLYPLRIPVIAIITEKARQISLRYFRGDIWKQDALRHTMWSFMLTGAFGPDFAQLVTDAQEAKPSNEHFERLMDYNNNAIGRAMVAEKVKLEQIPRLILQDPRIVLSPEDAKARGEEALLK